MKRKRIINILRRGKIMLKKRIEKESLHVRRDFELRYLRLI